MNIWRRQQCFVVIDTRLSLSLTHLTGKDGKAFVKKKQLWRQEFGVVIYLLIFAIVFCVDQTWSLLVWHLAGTGCECHPATRYLESLGDAWCGSVLSRTVAHTQILQHRQNKSLVGEHGRVQPLWCWVLQHHAAWSMGELRNSTRQNACKTCQKAKLLSRVFSIH